MEAYGVNALIENARNVVFDIGGVLLTFQPETYISRLATGEARSRVTCDMLYGSPMWEQLDGGLITEEEMARHAARSAGDESLWPQVLPAIQRYHELLEPMPAAALIPQLRALGKRVCVLSNYGPAPFARAEERFRDLFSQVDGMVISGREKISKPDPRIFRLLLERYHLDAGQTVFIDDRAVNVEGARKAGLSGIVYTGMDALLL